MLKASEPAAGWGLFYLAVLLWCLWPELWSASYRWMWLNSYFCAHLYNCTRRKMGQTKAEVVGEDSPRFLMYNCTAALKVTELYCTGLCLTLQLFTPALVSSYQKNWVSEERFCFLRGNDFTYLNKLRFSFILSMRSVIQDGEGSSILKKKKKKQKRKCNSVYAERCLIFHCFMSIYACVVSPQPLKYYKATFKV